MINNLKTQSPRSPKETHENIVGLPRLFDKLRARANSSESDALGEYKTGESSELDRQIMTFLSGENVSSGSNENFVDLRKNFENVFSTVTKDSTDEEIFNLILSAQPNLPSNEERIAWSEKMLKMKFVDDPDRTAYSSMLIEKMDLDPDITSFDFLLIGE